MPKPTTVKPILSRIFQTLFFASFAWIYGSIIVTNSGSMPWLSALLGIGFIAVGIAITVFCRKIAVKWKPKTIHFIFAGISAIMFALLMYFGFSLKATYTWDIAAIYNAAVASVTDTPDLSYFATCPNNIFIYLILKTFYKVVFALSGSTSVYYAIILNICFIYIGVLFTYLIANKLWGAHIGLLTAVVCFFFAPFYTYTSQYYTDTFALPFVVIPIYLYLCAVTSKKPAIAYTLYASAGILLALGYKLKGSVAIILAAILIHLILSQKILAFLKATAVMLAAFVVIFFSFNTIAEPRVVSAELRNENARPFTHYVMMGLSGDGGWNDEDPAFTDSIHGAKEKKQANIAEIKKRISEFGFAGLMNHLTNKAVHNTWGDGTYLLFGEGRTYLETNSKLWYFLSPKDNPVHREDCYNVFYYYSQGFHLALLTLLMLSLVLGIKNGKIDATLLCKLAVYGLPQIFDNGLFLFLLIWETRSRYIYSFTPLLLLIATDTLNQISGISLKNLKSWLTHQKDASTESSLQQSTR